MLNAITPLYHMHFECHSGFTGSGQNCTGEFNLFAIIFRIVLHDTFDYSAAPFSYISRKLDNYHS